MFHIARFRNSGNVEVGCEMERARKRVTTEISELLESGYEQGLVGFDDKLVFNHAGLNDAKCGVQFAVLLSICQSVKTTADTLARLRPTLITGFSGTVRSEHG